MKALLAKNISESSIGRIISRHQMFYRRRKRKPYSWSWGQKQRIKNLVEHGKPGEHLQVDTVVLHRHSKTYYVKTAIDTVTKIAFAYVYGRNTSQTAVDFLKKLQYVLPYEIKNMHTDNGSEFHEKFEEELRRQDIPHYFSYPHCPKQHGAVERFNRTLQEEFLQEGNFYPDIPFLNQKLMEWLIEYNFHRPHASLNYTNPLAFYDQHFVSLTPTEPSSMYWTSTGQFERQKYTWTKDKSLDSSRARVACWRADNQGVDSSVFYSYRQDDYLGSRGVLRVKLNLES